MTRPASSWACDTYTGATMTSNAVDRRGRQSRTIWATLVAEPVRVGLAQFHQVLISTASVTLMAQYAASSEILPPWVGYVLAVGVEWTYLRGLASEAKAPSKWGSWLNWSAFAILLLWGTLWCLRKYGVITEHPTDWLAFVLAASHVFPVAWVSLCSAQAHRALLQVETAQAQAEALADQERQRRLDDETAAQLRQQQQAEFDLQLKIKADEARLQQWAAAREIDARVKGTQANQPRGGSQPFTPGSMPCPVCTQSVEYTTPSEKGVIARRGCPACRANRKALKGGQS